jgi:hypothetical protein
MTYGQIMEEFGISKVVATLGLSLFVFGLGIGPMFLGIKSVSSASALLTIYSSLIGILRPPSYLYCFFCVFRYLDYTLRRC